MNHIANAVAAAQRAWDNARARPHDPDLLNECRCLRCNGERAASEDELRARRAARIAQLRRSR